MAGNNSFALATQYSPSEITIDGKDVIGMYQLVSVYENIFSPVITGSVVLLDTDANDFITKQEIEGNEEFEFTFLDANDNEFTFKGDLNGLRNKTSDIGRTLYTYDFTSKQVRKNEETFVVKRFKEQPKEIIEEMVEKLGGQVDKVEGEGRPMNFLGSRKRPTEIIKYVLTHGVSSEGNASATNKGTSQDEETKGTTGFLCWQTAAGYRFNSIDNILKGQGGEDHGELQYKIQNTGEGVERASKSILEYNFKQMGDMQSKMRSGGFKNVVVSFDLDGGFYKEYTYGDDKNMTDKQKEAVKFPTRYLWKPYANEKFEQQCTKAQIDQWDQSRLSAAQNTVRQNTFADQFGSFTLPPNLNIKAGDTFTAKIPKVESEKGSDPWNEKHSGKYVISQVGHHFYNDGKGYTKLETVRSTTQQDEYTSEQS